MGIVLAFAVGYVVGANAGQEGYQDVVDAVRSLRESDEFRALLSALRSHASAALRQVGDLVDQDQGEPFDPSKILDRVRDLMDRGGDRAGADGSPTGPAS
jgi:hypothetical protein